MAIGKQLSDGNPDGTSLGQSASDKVSVYGVTPVVQAALTCIGATCVVASTNAKINAIVLALRNFGITS